MAGLFANADKKEAQEKKAKSDNQKKLIFERIASILKQNFPHQNLAITSVSLKGGIGMVAHFGNVAYESNSKEILLDNLIQEAKLFIVKITLNQITCIILDEDKIRFSITEDHLSAFKQKFEELTFEQFIRENPKINEPNLLKPAQTETATPAQETVAPSEIKTNLNPTEMTNQPTTLQELFNFIKSILDFNKIEHGKHYKTLEINQKQNRIDFKANSHAIRKEVEGKIQAGCVVSKPENNPGTKTLWFSLLETSEKAKSTRGRKRVILLEERTNELESLRSFLLSKLEINGKGLVSSNNVRVNSTKEVVAANCKTQEKAEKLLAWCKSGDPQFIFNTTDSSKDHIIFITSYSERIVENENSQDSETGNNEMIKPEKLEFPTKFDPSLDGGVWLNKIFNEFNSFFNEYNKTVLENVSLKKQLANAEDDNYRVNEKEMLQMAIKLFYFNTAHEHSNIELWLRIKMDDGTETNIPIPREKFLEDFYQIFLAK